jgi:hypothetical protein
MGERVGGVDLLRVGLGLLFLCLADSLPGERGQSARSRQIWRSSCSSCVFAFSCFDPFRLVLLVAQSLPDGPRGECGQSLPRGRSTSWAPIVCFSRCTTGGSGAIYGGSDSTVQIVRPSPTDSLPPPCRQSAPGTTNFLSPLLLELRFCVALTWGLFLGLVDLL